MIFVRKSFFCILFSNISNTSKTIFFINLSSLVGINFPMATITTTHISNVWHFCNMALDCSRSLFTLFGQFLCCNLRILSDLVFYPFIKIFFLSSTLSITLSIIHCIIAIAFRYGFDPTGEKQHRMAAAYLLESYIDTPSSSLSGSLWWKEVSPC